MKAHYDECPYKHGSEDDRVHRALAVVSTLEEYMCRNQWNYRREPTTTSTSREYKCRSLMRIFPKDPRNKAIATTRDYVKLNYLEFGRAFPEYIFF